MKLRFLTMLLVLLGSALLPAGVRAQEQAAAPTSNGPDTVVFAAKRGAVTFTHAKHAQAAECKSCHHESRPEKPLESEHQKCSACHTDPVTAPLKTSGRNAMHDTVEKTGVCYDCHVEQAAAGKTVPAKCADCHKQEG